MIKNIIQFIFLSLILFTFSCCNQQEEANDNLNLTLAWEKDIRAFNPVVDYENKILFFENLGKGDELERIEALNLDTGEILWTTEETGYNSAQPVFDNSNVYTMNTKNRNKAITVIDKETGKIKSQTEISAPSTRFGVWTLYNGILYWGGRDSHFVYAYSTSDEKDAYPIWGSEDVTSDIMGDIVPYNGRLYFVSSVYPYEDEPQPARLVSMNPDGSDVKELEISADIVSIEINCTQFYKGKLYLNGKYFICVNPESMEIEWELKGKDDKEFFNSSMRGFVINDGYIYSRTEREHGNDDFICINTKNGKIVWHDKLDTNFYGSIFYSPQVYKGYIYQPMQGCVMVLNAKNGKYVGRDEKIRTGALAVDITAHYNDLMIFSGNHGKLYAVKMDMHTR